MRAQGGAAGLPRGPLPRVHHGLWTAARGRVWWGRGGGGSAGGGCSASFEYIATEGRVSAVISFTHVEDALDSRAEPLSNVIHIISREVLAP